MRAMLSIFALSIALFFLHFNNVSAMPTISKLNINDPFINTWLNFDGTETFSLTVTQSQVPGQQYGIRYSAPDTQEVENNMCKATSATAIQCFGGPLAATLTYDDSIHAVHLVTSSLQFTYYDPKYMPALPAVFGVWKYTHYNKYNNTSDTFTISVKNTGQKDQVRVTTSEQGTDGSYCYSYDDIYKVTTTTDGKQLFIGGNHTFVNGFMFDAAKNQLLKLPNPPNWEDNFSVPTCINFSSDVNVAFTKS